MSLRDLINETLIANNGELSSGLKKQLNMTSLMIKDNFAEKMALLKKEGISIYNYFGLRILGFSLEIISKVLEENASKLEIYRTNSQELVRDLRVEEIREYGSSLELELEAFK